MLRALTNRSTRTAPPGFLSTGYTVVEVLLLVVTSGILLTVGHGALLRFRRATALEAAGRVVRAQLARARLAGIARREIVRVRIGPEGDMTLFSEDESVLERTPLLGGEFGLDSVRLAPSTLSYNARGQSGAGSVYLYRGREGLRIVSNFIGRIRSERIRP